MADVSAKQPPVDDFMLTGDQAIQSGLLEAHQVDTIEKRTHALNDRWNALNVGVIEKEMR